jgi:uncharacterized repeat protein (TIGR01451 family)
MSVRSRPCLVFMAEERADSTVFSQLAIGLLGAGQRIRFQACGRSMLPAIGDGEILHVESPKPAKLRRGDIVLFSSAQGLKAHRIVRKQGRLFITRGDAGMDMDGVLRGDQVLGKVVAKECRQTGRTLSLTSARSRAGFVFREIRRHVAIHERFTRILSRYSIAMLALLFASLSVRAQVAVDHSVSNAQLLGGTGSIALTPISLNVTAGGANRLLVVGVSFNTTGNAASSVTGINTSTAGGGTKTFNSANSIVFDPGNNFRVEIWYLVAPNTGTNTITVTINKTGGGGNKLGVVVGAVDFTGADQTSPIRGSQTASGTSARPSVTIASGNSEMVLDTIATGTTVTATVAAGQTQRWNAASTGNPASHDVLGVGSTQPGAASVTMSETLSASTAWSDEAISIRPPGADLAIAKSGSPNPVLQNNHLTYTLTVTNNGPLSASTVIVTDTLPTQVSFVSAASSQGACVQVAGVVTCTIGTMTNLQTVTITIVTTAVTRSEATNTATVTTTSVDPDLTNNTASVTTLIESPTAVSLNSLAANQIGRGALLAWKTGDEVRNLGFNVYKEVSGERVRLNSSLIAGSALLMKETLPQHGAKTYGWIDRSPSPGALYWLEDVDLNGTRTMHGPVSLQAGSSQLPSGIRMTTFAEINTRALAGTQNSSVAHVREMLPHFGSAPASVGLRLAAQPAIKLFVDHEGWYRVTQPQLVAAGLDPNVDARSVHLFAEGVEQPIRLTGGRFGSQSAIEFYGTAIDTPFSGQRVYWLAASGGRPGLRISDAGNSGTAGPQLQSFTQTLELKPRTTYFAALLRENTDNFFGPLVTPTPESLTFNATNIAAGEGTLAITLQGATQGQRHNVTVMLNGSTLGNLNFAGQDEGTTEFSVPAGVVVNGSNTITLTAQQGASDISLVDVIEISFPHTFTADSDQLKFTAEAGASVAVAGFEQPPNRLIDITDPQRPFVVEHQIVAQNSGFTLRTVVPSTSPGQHTLLALADDQLAAPVSLVAHQPSNLHAAQAGANMVVLTAPQFAAEMQPLVATHQTAGTSAMLVSVDAVYDEFNFGERTPFAIRNFLRTATAAWTNKPQYLLLGGDASVDPRNYLGFGFFDFVPTRIIPTAVLKTASDDWFSDFNNTGIASIATGRMPGRTPDDMQTMVGKTLNYISNTGGGWNNQALFVADQNDDTTNFTSAAQAVQGLLPQAITATDVFVHDLGITTARQNLLDALNNGQLIVNYNGHGSVEVWSGSDLFDDTAASSLTNGDKLPLFVIMNCLNGFFHDVFTESMATALMLSPNGGAAAVWASSGLTPPDPQFQMDQVLMKTLFSQPNIALGDAALSAKSGISDQDVRRTFILFGDPLLQLKLPQATSTPVAPVAPVAHPVQTSPSVERFPVEDR